MGKFLAILAAGAAVGVGLIVVEGGKEEYCLWTIDKDNPKRRCAFACGPSKLDMKAQQKQYFTDPMRKAGRKSALNFEISKTKKRDEVFCS